MIVRWILGVVGIGLSVALAYSPHSWRKATAAPGFPPQRIVSLTLATDEVLLALVPPERIAALTYLADDPRYSNVAGAAGRISYKLRAQVEQVIAHQPDLVLAAPYTNATTRGLLEGAGLPLLTLGSYDSLADIQQNILLVGRAVGATHQAQQLVAGMQRRLQGIHHRISGAAPPGVLYYMPGGFTAGSQTIVNEIITRAGGRNLAAIAGIRRFKKLSKELLVALNPAVIVLGGDPAEDGQAGLPTLLLADPALQEVTAIQTRRIHVIPRSSIGTLSHHIVKGVEAMARVLHPDVFARQTGATNGRPVSQPGGGTR